MRTTSPSSEIGLEDRIEQLLINGSASSEIPQYDRDARLRAHIRAIIIEELQRARETAPSPSEEVDDMPQAPPHPTFEWFVPFFNPLRLIG